MSAYHRLNPLTKLFVAVAVAVDATLLGGIAAPLTILLVGVVVPAIAAGVLRVVTLRVLLLTLPVGLSAFLLAALFQDPMSPTLVALGPIHASAQGVAAGIALWARFLVYGGAAVLFHAATRTDEMQRDAEHRGLPARFAYLLDATVRALPGMQQRAQGVLAAQRARALGSSGAPLARLHGLRPLIGAVVLGTLRETDQRALALDARAFGHLTHRTLLWAPVDSTAQRLARAVLAFTIPLTIAWRLTHG